MKLTLSKTLLSAAVMLGLTACSSGGGGGSNEPMTTQNKNQVAVPPSNTNTKPANNNQTTNNTNSSGNSSSNQKASNTNETINIPVIKNPTENTPKEMVWGVLPEMPKIETSRVSGHGTELKGKATYLYKGGEGYAEIYENDSFGGKSYYSDSVSENDGKGYIVLNADFDNKKISGSAAYNLYGTRDNRNEVKRQVELTFKDTSLYKGGNHLKFNGEATGKLLSKDLKEEELSGSYSGDISSNGKGTSLHYNIYTPGKNIKVTSRNAFSDSVYLHKQ